MGSDGSQECCPCRWGSRASGHNHVKRPVPRPPPGKGGPAGRGFRQGVGGESLGALRGSIQPACKALGPQGPRGSIGGCERVVLHSQARCWRERRRAAAAVRALLPAPLLPMPFLPPGFFPDSQHHHPKVSLEEGICLLVCLFSLCLIRGRREEKSHKQSTRLLAPPLLYFPPPAPFLPSRGSKIPAWKELFKVHAWMAANWKR